MKRALFAALAILVLTAMPQAARALPRLVEPRPIAAAAPSFVVPIRHHHHHHWRHWSRRGEPADDDAREETGTSTAPPASGSPTDAGKPTIQWVDPDRAR